ncbi:outer membrane protein transport protein [Sulfitobacter guttiformis]|uniref:Long-subunit fatty acid transport protein n=1 Tax=Sulfitobacter guttiformis TaxID=74349 RepID=A0A420DI59_9RHOB|nr:outer membrane protein transport protein [Sulfitobacter guttiformis]KIN72311.1 Outer membrane protein transport protein (OMPP1/FadL/TodX) [Sulfitobacter guttiformis KCTC 32187]RKE93926.1 long-subunit fatty acid transport protein [Sulfitobacter guttiformis]
MKTRFLTVAALLASTVSAQAVGLDRAGQRVGILFETGNHAELTFSYTDPSISGNAYPAFGGGATGNVGQAFRGLSGGIKYDLNDQLSLAFIADEPYGADTLYPGSSTTTILGTTGATVDSYALTALANYRLDSNWSVHGGLRYQEISAGVTLGGLAFNAPGTAPGTANGVNGYSGTFGSDGAVGYVIGGAYEIPDIALRVAVTYNSSTSHDLATRETIRGAQISAPGAITEVDTPESLNIAFQTGVAKDTLVFGSLRYARYSDTVVSPAGFSGATGNALTDLEDGFDFDIGVGRRFSEQWSGSVSVGFSTKGDDDFVSPLAPTNGSKFIAVGAKYDVNDSFAISGGVRYTSLGDAVASPGGRGVAPFEGNDAVSVGLKLAYKF